MSTRIEKHDKRYKNRYANRIYYFQSCFNLPFPPSIWQLKQNSKPVSLFSSGSSLGTVSFFRRLKHRLKSELDTASFPPSMGVDDCAFSGTGSSDKTGVYFPFGTWIVCPFFMTTSTLPEHVHTHPPSSLNITENAVPRIPAVAREVVIAALPPLGKLDLSHRAPLSIFVLKSLGSLPISMSVDGP